ncbi:MAG: phosphonate C-P lyase system protein PhnL [Rhodobacteraceae bacterium]|nr:phosphonate C-P lyase system protein PhnL [Paracoccaceae bacterium]
MITVSNLSKYFVLHNQNSAVIPVMDQANFSVSKGECVALVGQSGAGKSTLMRMIYGNYVAQSGDIWIGDTNVVGATARDIIDLRRKSLGYVSQFLRVVPRVPTRDVVAEPLLALGEEQTKARRKAEELLSLLNIPEHLWDLSPTTFSGGEQQRVNIARGFVYDYPALLLDEPTASLDVKNRSIVLGLVESAKARGAAIIGIFHDEAARDQVCDRVIDVTQYTPKAA